MDRKEHARRTLAPLLALAACLLLLGCQKRVAGPLDAQGISYLKAWTFVRAAPEANAKILAKAGPNARARVSETKDAWSKVSLDDGRVIGWVETASLSAAPVKESKPSAASKTKPKAPTKKTAAPGTPEKAAPEAAVSAEEQIPVIAPEAAASEPAAPEAAASTGEQGTGPLSPTPAAAAPIPPKEVPKAPPASSRQAKPEAFEPF